MTRSDTPSRTELAQSGEAVVTVTVEGRNDAPVAQNDNYTIEEEGRLIVAIADGVLRNDLDPEGSPHQLDSRQWSVERHIGVQFGRFVHLHAEQGFRWSRHVRVSSQRWFRGCDGHGHHFRDERQRCAHRDGRYVRCQSRQYAHRQRHQWSAAQRQRCGSGNVACGTRCRERTHPRHLDAVRQRFVHLPAELPDSWVRMPSSTAWWTASESHRRR